MGIAGRAASLREDRPLRGYNRRLQVKPAGLGPLEDGQP